MGFCFLSPCSALSAGPEPDRGVVWCGFSECARKEGLCGLSLWGDGVTSLSDGVSPAIFVRRLMEVLRKLVGIVSLLSPPYPLLRFQPFHPALGKAVPSPPGAVTALTPLTSLPLNQR